MAVSTNIGKTRKRELRKTKRAAIPLQRLQLQLSNMSIDGIPTRNISKM